MTRQLNDEVKTEVEEQATATNTTEAREPKRRASETSIDTDTKKNKQHSRATQRRQERLSKIDQTTTKNLYTEITIMTNFDQTELEIQSWNPP